MHKVPLFLLPTLALIVELALQYFPQTGVFLMMLGAPGWSVLIVNAILVALAIDAWRGTLPRWVMGIPITLYAGYYGLYAVSLMEYMRLNGEIESANAAQRVAFDPLTQDLAVNYVAVPPSGTPLIGQAIVSSFNLPVAYEINWREVGKAHAVRIMARAQCDAWKGRRSGRVRTSGLLTDTIFVRNACIGETDDRPQRDAVTLHPGPKEVSGTPLQPVELRPIEIAGSDGRRIRLITGTTQVLTFIPMPIVGCTLISSEPAWRCFAHFHRTMRALGGDHNPAQDGRAKVAARALGLVPRKVVSVENRRIPLGKPSGNIDPSEIPTDTF